MNSFQLWRIKIHIVSTPAWNHTFKIPPDTQHHFGAEAIFNDGFGSLTGTEPLFRCVRFAIIYPFLVTCDNSLYKSIIHVITDKLTTDIHSTLSLLRCEFMKYRSTASVWFYKCLNLALNGIFYAPSTFDSLRILFCGSSSKILHTFSISHNLGLPERGKSLVFSSPVWKLWNHHCATRSLTTTSPSISRILRAAAAPL